VRAQRLNLGQRLVLVAALAASLFFFGSWVTSEGWDNNFGWTAFAPLSKGTFVPVAELHSWVRLVVWLLLTLVWTVASLVLLRSSAEAS
jgi:hypothetical protein